MSNKQIKDKKISKIMNQSNESNESNEYELSINDNCNYNIKQEYANLNCEGLMQYSNECNKFKLKKEILESSCLETKENENEFLYPNLNDNKFNIKIAEKKEFSDLKYDGFIYEDIKKQADLLANAEFEIQPHQAFAKNFMSSQTPYNSLLLFHGLGSGKTCTAIGVCEEMRDYIKQTGMTKRIIIVASENVQDNFKLQLFDERKLKLVDGIWNIRSCIGNKLIQEVNPMNMKGITKEKLVSQIKNLINTYYLFLGYGQFANYIMKTIDYDEEIKRTKIEKKNSTEKTSKKEPKISLNNRIIKKLQNEFNNRLVVIDEVHNIRMADDNENKKVALNLELLVKSAENMRFLFLSATPMYNNYKEIIWLLNLMNINDRRAKINIADVFDKNGNFKKDGEELLMRKSTGYVSFVRGENPYTFPYRVYPSIFAKNNTFKKFNDDKNGFVYPSYQMNLKKIKNEDKNRILSLYLNVIDNCNNCGLCQYCNYRYIIYNLRNKKFKVITKKGVVREMPSFENMESFGYTLLQTPLESLIISYPNDGIKEIIQQLPREKYIEVVSEKFAENNEISDIEKESPGPVSKKSYSFMSESESSPQPEVELIKDSNLENVKQIAGKISSTDSDYEEGNDNDKNDDESDEDVVKEKKKITKFNIDPHDLTGKQGLERMMDFIDNKSPPEKGSFTYKKSTTDKYGKIFSSELIGKYSVKIKCILDKIYNTKNKEVSEGIILIYSQYIDAGLIPMALALEEMGFTRYAENAKPLFKNKPSDIVDVRTMQTPKDKKDFMPARYALITGDPRLSPNNDYEVKGLTNEDNKDGHKVKVILISKAGSEGIDFKFIRQVHILEPWYNMNRIEQIIGRAVRNFSHKDLPFEKRNVEIFMYGTILGKENKEEAADLYVYRVAEYKALQIGKVTRILKENSVDCIINYEQSNFSQENISEKLKKSDIKITQILSTGEKITDFKIGDQPFSPACDYMAKCNYNCKLSNEYDENKLNEDTYNEYFIMMNSEKIIKKIRGLFKEEFFYKKDVLLDLIKTPKSYPLVQIFAALTQLIENNNEFIVDKYGRNGRLVNVGDYYLFQPVELRDKNISIFERSVPIDYKHEMIDFQISKNIDREAKEKRDIEKVLIENKQFKPEMITTSKILDELKSNYDLTIEYTKKGMKVNRGDDNWFKHCGIVMKKLVKDYPDIKDYFKPFLVAHMIELLLFDEKLELLNLIYSFERIENDSVESYIKEYFDMNSIVTKNATVIFLYNLNKMKIMTLDNNNKWTETGPEDQRLLFEEMNQMVKNKKKSTSEIEKIQDILNFDLRNYNNIIGFIGYEKSNRYLVFKTKDINSKRDTGARCDEAGKSKTLDLLNTIIGEEKYTKENTKLQKDEDGNVLREPTGQSELCVLEEMLMRYFNAIKRNNKKWFLTPEMAIYHKLYTVLVK
jgi:hypothetical protein